MDYFMETGEWCHSHRVPRVSWSFYCYFLIRKIGRDVQNIVQLLYITIKCYPEPKGGQGAEIIIETSGVFIMIILNNKTCKVTCFNINSSSIPSEQNHGQKVQLIMISNIAGLVRTPRSLKPLSMSEYTPQ